MNKENRGGKRENAGRKPKYKERTTTLSFRVPISKVREIKDVVRYMIES